MGYMCEDRRDRDYASKGQSNLNTILGAIGTFGALNNGNGLPFIGCGNNNAQKMDELRAENAELKAEKYAENTTQALYNKVVADNKELSGFLCDLKSRVATLEGDMKTAKVENENAILRERIANMEITNGLGRRLDACEASIPLVQERLMGAISTEREARECGDNAIVNYSNATFYPKMVSDVTTGTTTTAQVLYNPLPCQCLKRCA